MQRLGRDDDEDPAGLGPQHHAFGQAQVLDHAVLAVAPDSVLAALGADQYVDPVDVLGQTFVLDVEIGEHRLAQPGQYARLEGRRRVARRAAPGSQVDDGGVDATQLSHALHVEFASLDFRAEVVARGRLSAGDGGEAGVQAQGLAPQVVGFGVGQPGFGAGQPEGTDRSHPALQRTTGPSCQPSWRSIPLPTLALSRRTALGLGVATLLPPALALAAPAGQVLAYERRLRDQLSARRGDFDADFERELLDQGDAFRQARRLAPLAFDPGLALAARAHAADIARSEVYDHITRDGFGPAARVGLLARDLVGAPAENIAMRRNASGQVRPDQIMGQWKSSPGHRANLLAPGFTHVGYGALREGPRVVAVGVYAEVTARLPAPAPLRAPSVEAIAQALSQARPRIDQFSLSEPGGEVLTQTYVERPEPVSIPPGAWQLRPHLSTGPHSRQVAWGPVFVLG